MLKVFSFFQVPLFSKITKSLIYLLNLQSSSSRWLQVIVWNLHVCQNLTCFKTKYIKVTFNEWLKRLTTNLELKHLVIFTHFRDSGKNKWGINSSPLESQRAGATCLCTNQLKTWQTLLLVSFLPTRRFSFWFQVQLEASGSSRSMTWQASHAEDAYESILQPKIQYTHKHNHTYGVYRPVCPT